MVIGNSYVAQQMSHITQQKVSASPKSSANEEANESAAEKASETKNSVLTSNKIDIRA